MNPELVGILAVVAMFVLLALRVPVAYTLGFVGLGGYLAIKGLNPALGLAGVAPFTDIAKYEFAVVPLFMIMGHFVLHTGLAGNLMSVARLWIGWLPGGLVQATILAGSAFASVCGSDLAACSVLSKVTIPEMMRQGVSRPLAYGAIAASATLATMIPPSNLLVIYGIISQQSIGKLLIAGIVPGLLAGINYMILVYIRVKRNPALAPSLTDITWKDRFVSLKNIWGIFILVGVIWGGIYTGVFTPTEAGGVGAFVAFMMALRKLRWPQLRDSLFDTMKTASMIFLIVSAAFIFGYLISISGLPARASEFASRLPPWGLLGGIMLLYIILGFFMNMIAVMFITLPILLPAVAAAGFNLIWFGILVVQTCEIALLTPPFGLNLFVLKSVVPDSKMSEVIAGIWPFVAVQLLTLLIYIIFPQVTLFLPERMG